MSHDGRSHRIGAGRSLVALGLVLAMIALAGCDGRTALGGAAGAAAGAGGYEVHLNRQKQRVEREFREGEIDEREYEIRLDQIRRDSLLQ